MIDATHAAIVLAARLVDGVQEGAENDAGGLRARLQDLERQVDEDVELAGEQVASAKSRAADQTSETLLVTFTLGLLIGQGHFFTATAAAILMTVAVVLALLTSPPRRGRQRHFVARHSLAGECRQRAEQGGDSEGADAGGLLRSFAFKSDEQSNAERECQPRRNFVIWKGGKGCTDRPIHGAPNAWPIWLSMQGIRVIFATRTEDGHDTDRDSIRAVVLLTNPDRRPDRRGLASAFGSRRRAGRSELGGRQ